MLAQMRQQRQKQKQKQKQKQQQQQAPRRLAHNPRLSHNHGGPNTRITTSRAVPSRAELRRLHHPSCIRPDAHHHRHPIRTSKPRRGRG